MRPRRTWWMIFAGVTVLVTVVLVGITVQMVRLERAEIRARDEATHQESLRLALWRMDSWFAPRLAREAARQYFDYLPFHPQERAYTRLLNAIESGEVLTPSPLLTFESEYIRLHFQIDAAGNVTSPQVPTGNLRDLAEGSYVLPERLGTSAATLGRVRELVSQPELAQCVLDAETSVSQLATGAATPPPAAFDPAAQMRRSAQELERRQQAYVQSTSLGADEATGALGGAVRVGPLVPVWPGSGGRLVPGEPPALLFVRRVEVAGDQRLQGFLCDWTRLRAALTAEIADLLPDGVLVPVPTVPLTGAHLLATIPARLEVTAPVSLGVDGLTATRTMLLVAWLAVVAGLIAVAVTLRASIAFGEARSRFASAVTHELRTPLTTFRMYSEMLAEGMVRSEDQRREYLRTLKDEADRLGTLVENVLAYARIERGGADIVPDDATVAALLDRIAPALERRAAHAGMTLRIEARAPADTCVRVDPEALSQILSNLVDNACKYGQGDVERGTTPVIHLETRCDGADLILAVRDHGPGIPARHARTMFTPFERGAHGDGRPIPGVGLGLALARGLARRLGGDVRLAPTNSGACFEVSIPTTRS